MLFRSAEKKKSPVPEKGPIYGHHSTRLKTPSRETGKERERWRGKDTENMGCCQLSTELMIEYE